MSSAEIRSFFFRLDLKADKELEGLRPLNPTLNKKQLIAGTYEAVVNHWLEFECPKDPGRKFMEESLIDVFFVDKYEYPEGHMKGGFEGENGKDEYGDEGMEDVGK
jgi:hypothetical protein